MKTNQLLPLVATVAVGAGWLFSQRRVISSVEQETAALNRRVEAAKPTAQEPADNSRDAPREVVTEEPFDWQELLSRPRGGDPREDMRFQQRLGAMTVAEISATLDEIAGLDLPENSREKLTRMFTGALVMKDPEMALKRFYKDPDPRGQSSPADPYMKRALSNWAAKNPANASAWLDSKIASGELVSKSLAGVSQHRVEYEEQLIRVLSTSDLPAAEKRLVAMSEDEAARVLATLLSDHRSDGTPSLAAATMTRNTLPEKQALEALSSEASSRSYGGRDRVTDYVTTIRATPAERNACVKEAARALVYQLGTKKTATDDTIDDLRSWVAASQSDSTDLVIGNALARAVSSQGMEFDQASALLLQQFEKYRSDDLIIGFLADGNEYSPDEARTLAGKVSDPTRRAEMLGKIR